MMQISLSMCLDLLEHFLNIFIVDFLLIFHRDSLTALSAAARALSLPKLLGPNTHRLRLPVRSASLTGLNAAPSRATCVAEVVGAQH